MTKDFKIAYPDPNELVYQSIILLHRDKLIQIHAPVKAKYIIDALLVFRPVVLDDEIIYNPRHVFFKHLN